LFTSSANFANAAIAASRIGSQPGTLPIGIRLLRIWPMTRAVLAAAVLCLGLFCLLYGFAGTSEALKSIFVGTGLVLTAIGATWLGVELFA
jgi:hypothetical protein